MRSSTNASTATVAKIRGCFESTEWSMFFDSCSSHDELAETLSDYLRFCEDCVITSVIIFPNNKPWVTKELKIYLNKKKYAFIRGNKAEVRELDKEFRRKAELGKLAYKDKVEWRKNSMWVMKKMHGGG